MNYNKLCFYSIFFICLFSSVFAENWEESFLASEIPEKILIECKFSGIECKSSGFRNESLFEITIPERNANLVFKTRYKILDITNLGMIIGVGLNEFNLDTAEFDGNESFAILILSSTGELIDIEHFEELIQFFINCEQKMSGKEVRFTSILDKYLDLVCEDISKFIHDYQTYVRQS